MKETNNDLELRKGIFPREEFTYNPDTDTFTCPAGKLLVKKSFKKKRQHFEYKASSKA